MRQVRNLILSALITTTVSFAFGWTLLLPLIAFLVGAMATRVRIIYWEWDQEWFGIALASIVGSCVGGYVWYLCTSDTVGAIAGALFIPSFILGSALMAFLPWSLMKIVRSIRRSSRRPSNLLALMSFMAMIIMLAGCGRIHTEAERIQTLRERVSLGADATLVPDSMMVKDGEVRALPSIGIGLVIVERRSDGNLFNAKVRLPFTAKANQMVAVTELAYYFNDNGLWHRDNLWIVQGDSTKVWENPPPPAANAIRMVRIIAPITKRCGSEGETRIYDELTHREYPATVEFPFKTPQDSLVKGFPYGYKRGTFFFDDDGRLTQSRGWYRRFWIVQDDSVETRLSKLQRKKYLFPDGLGKPKSKWKS